MPFSVPSTLEKHMRKCISTNNSAANVNQNSNSSSGGNLGNLSNNATNSSLNEAQLLNNNANNLLGFAGLTGNHSLFNDTLLNMVNSARSSPNSKLDSNLLSSLKSAGLLNASNEQLLDT